MTYDNASLKPPEGAIGMIVSGQQNSFKFVVCIIISKNACDLLIVCALDISLSRRSLCLQRTCPPLFTLQRYNTNKLFARKMRDIFRPFQVGKKCRQNGETLCDRAFAMCQYKVGNGSEDFLGISNNFAFLFYTYHACLIFLYVLY